MSLDDIVKVNIDVKSPKVTRAGFGVPLILGYHTAFAGYVKTYSEASELLDDGFTVDSPEYKLATILKSQTRSVSKFKVGRRETKTLQKLEITPLNTTVGFNYSFRINNLLVEYEVQAGDDVADIIAGLQSQIATVAAAAFITATMATGHLKIDSTLDTKLFTLTMNQITSANVEILDVSVISANIANDLNKIKAEDNDFYCILSTSNSPADILSIKTWVESNTKIFISDVCSQDIIESGSSDIASVLKLATINRTSLIYSKNVNEYKAAAWAGLQLTRDPGSSTWNFKILSGVSADRLSASEETNNKLKNANFFTTVAGSNIMQTGIVSSGEYLDVIRFIDWLRANLQADVYSVKIANPKIPFTDNGIALITGTIYNRLQLGVKAGGIDGAREIIVTAPKVADIPITKKVARDLPDVNFSCYLAGAIHSTKIEGVISV